MARNNLHFIDNQRSSRSGMPIAMPPDADAVHLLLPHLFQPQGFPFYHSPLNPTVLLPHHANRDLLRIPYLDHQRTVGMMKSSEPKPPQSYIGLIAMAILDSPERRLVLNDIYQWIMDNYPYFQCRGTGWKNSIRHNLSLNDCFVKVGRCPNGKGHYWSVHPANIDDFMSGDFRRRRAQQRVKKHQALLENECECETSGASEEEECNDVDMPTSQHPAPSPTTAISREMRVSTSDDPKFDESPTQALSIISSRKRRSFNIDSILSDDYPSSSKRLSSQVPV